MERVGVRELRQNLSVYLRRVARGETLEVTEHGRPVAVLAPLPDSSPLAALAAAGRLRRASAALEDLAAPVSARTISATNALAEQRAGDR
ncbi:MAG TPA: type II toxin-antitoxin system prevent-host-death family antitoxin [Mycobacteriales bacterium]|nr:type II toxin-antitoxin system prevent-host-death family antitoxin [Mycobacteriales bacterium]